MTGPQLVRLRDLGRWSGGNTPSKANACYWADGTIPWVSPKDMKVDEIWVSEDRISQQALDEGRVSMVPEGSVLLVTRSGILSHTLPVAVTRVPVTVNQDLKALSPRPDVLPRYVAHAVRGLSQRILKSCAKHGTTVASIDTNALLNFEIPMLDLDAQRATVAEIETQFSRLDEAVASLHRIKSNLRRNERATIQSLVAEASAKPAVSGAISDVATSLDNMRKPVNKTERAGRPGSVPYLGANGQTGWIDRPLFDEELVLVVEDETFVGRTAPFSYYFSGKCWVNNHTHVLRAKAELVIPKYLNLALSYYPFIPLTTGSTGRRKLTKAALMGAPLSVPSLDAQRLVVEEVERRLSINCGVQAHVETNLKRAQALRQAVLAKAFGGATEPLAEESAT
jgi:type I restriction enzyme S subunit